MRVRTAFVLGGLALSAGTATPLVPVLAASAAFSGVLLTEFRMAECLSPTTRGIRPATAQPGAARRVAATSVPGAAGHRSAVGSEELNKTLLLARAQVVRAYLAEQGMARRRLAASGVGKSDHKNPQDPLAAENRRVEIVSVG